MNSTINPTDIIGYLYNRKSSDQAITTIPRRDKIIPGSKIFEAPAQSTALYQKDVQNDITNTLYDSLDGKKNDSALILQELTRIDKAITMANDMRISEQERRESARDFVQALIDNRWTVRFHRDNELGKIITQMIEVGSGEVKLSFPPQRTIDFEKFMQNYTDASGVNYQDAMKYTGAILDMIG
jgi:hypothetical protein